MEQSLQYLRNMGGAARSRRLFAPLIRPHAIASLRTVQANVSVPEPGKGSGANSSRRTGGDWAALERGGERAHGNDYLVELGQAQDYNINVDHGS